MQRFVKEELTHQVIFAPIAMRHFWKHLRDQGIVPMVAAPHLDDPCEPLLRNYDEHLCNVRGLALTSRTESLRYARRFLNWLRDRHGDEFLDRLSGVDVLEFITEWAGLHPSGSWRNNLCSYTRVFLRYLRWRGIIEVDLDRVVPKLPKWRLSDVPRHLPWEEVRRLIESVDTSRPTGLRDKAVLLLIAVLGLRNQEVSAEQTIRLIGELLLHHPASYRSTTKRVFRKSLELSGRSGIHIWDYLVVLPFESHIDHIYTMGPHFRDPSLSQLAAISNPLAVWKTEGES